MTSRNPTSKPRKLAGQQAISDQAVVEPPEIDETAPPEPPDPPDEELPPGGGGGRDRGKRTTIALVVAIVVLLAVGILEIVYLTRDATATVSSARPVVTGELTHQSAVDTAAKSTVEILSTSYEDYDDQIDQATGKMTDSFAAEYRETAEGIRDRFVDQQTKLSFEVVGQSVVQASPEQVQALLFLNQYVEKVEDGEPQTDYAQYRALVTVVHTDHGWLVSDIETK
jgi:Mce-associated membrane protein